MRILQDEGSLPLFELAKRAGLSRPTVFRLLATLQDNGILLKDAGRKYRLAGGDIAAPHRYKIGYASQTSEYGFSRAVTRGIVESAEHADVDIVLVDNQYSPEVAVANAEMLLDEKIDLMMEFQTHASVASLISGQASKHNVPLIAIEIPHPEATYFGVNNCQAGIVAGRHIANWADQHWEGKVDEVLLVGMPQVGSLPEARLTGSLLGIRETLPNLADIKISVVSGNGQRDTSREAVRQHLKSSTAKRVLVSAINDLSAIGAQDAFKEAGCLQNCAIVGQNGSIEARLEMRDPDSRLVGSVAYFPEQYGEQLVPLALNILSRRNPVPRAVYIKHQLLTPSNLKQYYGRETHAAKTK
jgi:ribose transport system substrate-binding protein